MIKEAFISFEIAKLLKEKGFDESTYAFYVPYEDGDVKFIISKYEEKFNTVTDHPWLISAPTHQMALKWLREEKNIHIDFYYLPIHKKYMWSVVETKDPKGTGSEELYEDAVETALKYCLEKLIK